MLNFYDYIANSKYFKTFRVDDLLLVEYKCVIPSDRVAFWSHNNYFAFVLTGQSRYYEGEKEYVIDAGQAMFVRKGAYIAEQHRKGDYCALAIFLSDEFIRRVVDKYAPSGIADAVIGMTNNDSVFPIAVEESLTSYFYSVLSYFSKEKAPSGEYPREVRDCRRVSPCAGGSAEGTQSAGRCPACATAQAGCIRSAPRSPPTRRAGSVGAQGRVRSPTAHGGPGSHDSGCRSCLADSRGRTTGQADRGNHRGTG